MPIFELTMSFLDDRNGVTDKTYEGDFLDFATARTAAATFVTESQAITAAAIFQWTLKEIVLVASTPTAGSRVTDRMSATLYLDQASNKKANFLYPSPAPAILSGNTLLQSAAWDTFIANLQAAGGGWFISDGENVDAGGNGTVSGKLISVRSGVRTLPS